MKPFETELKELATLREIKGSEKQALDKINELVPRATEAKAWKTVAKLYWEAHLVWQHLVMNEHAKNIAEKDTQLINEGTEKMMHFAELAKNIIEENNIEEMLGGAYRFMGRAATYAANHLEAKKLYELAISKYSGNNLKSKLEVSGFLADSLIRLGKFKEGTDLATSTYDDFYNSDIGKSLKATDYFTWAVWMSGIAPRTCNALLDLKAPLDKTYFENWLLKVAEELKNPSGDVTWGDNRFQFRLDELASALKRLETLPTHNQES